MAKYWFDHVHMTSPDPVKTAEFYEKTFGAERLDMFQITDRRTNVFFDLNGTVIKVVQPRPQPLLPGAPSTVYGVEHLGMRTNNLVEAVVELKAKGVKFVRDITPDTHSPARPTPTRPGLTSTQFSFFLAPENVVFELFEARD